LIVTDARALDQFFTRDDVAARCLERLYRHVDPKSDAHFWIEPSAGSGAFFDQMPTPRIGMDIAPLRHDILPSDFFAWTPWTSTRSTIVVGNPPFGKNAAIARRFFDHAASFADIVAFILPRTFQKPNFVNRLDRHMHLIDEMPLDDCSFEFKGVPYAVPTVFQIWEKRVELRPLTASTMSHPHFSFVAARDAHFAFQRVGARAGMVSFEGLTKSAQSHYFLKANVDADSLFEKLRSIDWNEVKWRTAGNPSIGKGELISNYETALA
jgi:hypothetical protein